MTPRLKLPSLTAALGALLLPALWSACSSTTEGTSSAQGTGASAPGGEGGDGSQGGSASGGAGQGGTGNTCADADEDGVTTCDGDCDDADAASYPGHAEICGDLADNDCEDGADDPCEGIGTFVSVKTGNDDNPGTKEEPVKTLARGMANAAQLGGGYTVYVADGVYAEDPIELVETVSLEGGYLCDASKCDWSRKADACLTILRPESEKGVLADETITRKTRIDGFAIEGKTGAGAGIGRAALTLDGGTPIVSNNCIQAPDVTSGAHPLGRSLGVVIQAPLNDEEDGVLLDNNEVRGGSAMAGVDAITVLVGQDTATDFSVVHLRGNRIWGGSGGRVTGVNSNATAPGSVFENNDVSAGQATNWTYAMYVSAGDVTIDGNRFNMDPDFEVSGAGSTPELQSGGLRISDANAVVTNNVGYGAKAAYTAALVIWPAIAGTREIVVNGNTFFAGTIDPGALAASSSAFTMARCASGCEASRGRIRNNIFATANSSGGRYPVWEVSVANYGLLQPVAFENNILDQGAGSPTQTLYVESGSTHHTTIAAVNAMVVGSSAIGDNLDTDPKVDAEGHVGLGSLARDSGTQDDAADHDMDGDSRPLGDGYDIGADESQ